MFSKRERKFLVKFIPSNGRSSEQASLQLHSRRHRETTRKDIIGIFPWRDSSAAALCVWLSPKKWCHKFFYDRSIHLFCVSGSSNILSRELTWLLLSSGRVENIKNWNIKNVKHLMLFICVRSSPSLSFFDILLGPLFLFYPRHYELTIFKYEKLYYLHQVAHSLFLKLLMFFNWKLSTGISLCVYSGPTRHHF